MKVVDDKSGGSANLGDWVTAKSYNIGEEVIFTEGGGDKKLYTCLTAHTSGVFATDLSAGNWKQVGDGVVSPKEFITLTDSATISWDYALGSNAQVTLTASRILGTPSNVEDGDYGTLKTIQDGAGGHALTLPATFQVVNGGAGALTLTTTASSVDVICWVYDGTNFWVTFGLNFT